MSTGHLAASSIVLDLAKARTDGAALAARDLQHAAAAKRGRGIRPRRLFRSR